MSESPPDFKALARSWIDGLAEFDGTFMDALVGLARSAHRLQPTPSNDKEMVEAVKAALRPYLHDMITPDAAEAAAAEAVIALIRRPPAPAQNDEVEQDRKRLVREPECDECRAPIPNHWNSCSKYDPDQRSKFAKSISQPAPAGDGVTDSCGCVFCDLNILRYSAHGSYFHDVKHRRLECTSPPAQGETQ